LATRENVEEAIVLSEEELVEVKQTVGEVHEQVLRLQGELARIDARIKRRAERTLIEKGLRTPRPGQYSDGTVVGEGPLFAWPVYGPISAGFLDARYRKVFGVPHHGMDIATPQGTAVRSVADGVVFLVKNGGAKGYTYVLVGHQDGYATLYGHLSSVSVATGEDIVRGQVIGFSGGMRGTPGAGLMTTGPHLHLEVILNGVNLNPATVLP
jgi:murein DD-endopeptidase MepM/ murein hydrolase activator NlpD